MKMNVEKLVNTVIDYFENAKSYYCKEWEQKNRAEWWYFERNFFLGNKSIEDICEICDFDYGQLALIAKKINKWHENSNWEKSFPFEENSQQIIKFIEKKHDESFTEKWSWLQPAIQRYLDKKIAS